MKPTRIHVILLALIFLNINAAYATFYPGDSNSVHFYYHKLRDADKKFFFRHGADSLRSPVVYTKKVSLKKNVCIFGWHPHWMGSTYKHYNYSLLTHVAYFSCDVDPGTGTLSALNGWDTSSIVSFVKKQNPACKVLLTVTCFGKSSIAEFLNSASSKKKLIDELVTVITAKNGDGVCMDFEGMGSTEKTIFSNFITDLHTRFKQNGWQVFITLPAVDNPQSAYDFISLRKSVDHFVLMGYDYFGAFSDKYNAGPIAPLKTKSGWIPVSIETSVDHYLNNNVPDSLLLLGVPYYGAIWETKSMAIPSGPAHFVGYRSYSYALSLLPNFVNDTVLDYSSYSFKVEKPLGYRQFWLDGDYSLGTKYDYVLKKNLGGIGIWALGFDEGSDKLWQLLETKFGETTTKVKTATVPETNYKSINSLLRITETKPSVLGIVLFLVLLTLLIVLLTVVSNPVNRAKLKSAKLFYVFMLVVLALFGFSFFVLCLFCFKLSITLSIILLTAALIMTYAAKTVFKFRSREMP